MSLLSILNDALQAYAKEEDDRHEAIMGLLINIRDAVMPLAPEVQALHDAVAAQGSAIVDAVAEIVTLENTATSLQAQIAAVKVGAPIDADDLAEIVAATNAITSSVQVIKNVMPQPVPTPVVDAAAAASPTV